MEPWPSNAKATANSALSLSRIPREKIRVQAFCDASLGSNNSVYANSGVIVLVGGTPMHWLWGAVQKVSLALHVRMHCHAVVRAVKCSPVGPALRRRCSCMGGGGVASRRALMRTQFGARGG